MMVQSVLTANTSKKLEAVTLVKWLTKKSIENIQEQLHQQATQLQQAIKDCYNRIHVIQYENIVLQGKIRAKD